MTIKNTTSIAPLQWSQVALTLELPESIKQSIVLSASLNSAKNDASKEVTVSINEAWKKTSDYALDRVSNESRDYDRLARATTRRARLPIPSLELLADFPYGTISSPQVEKKCVEILRISSAKSLDHMSKLSSPEVETSEDELPRLHDFYTVEETYKLICKLSELDHVSVRPLISALIKTSPYNYLPPAYQDASRQREIAWGKLSARHDKIQT